MKPLVLVHGFMGGSAQWDGIRPALEGGADLVTLDLPGFGKNHDLPPINRIEDFAEWVIATLKDKGIRSYDLLGHSMGGMIAQEVARRDSQALDRLFLYATGSIGVVPGRFETMEDSKARAVAEGARATARRISATWFLECESAPAYPACAALAELSSLEAILAGLDAMQAWSGQDALNRIAQKTLILWGDSDRTYNWDQIKLLWTQIPDAGLAVLPRCAHAAHMEKPHLFCDVLRDALT
ncbi:MAG: alpha/beta fold hydrolase [Pseudomonadota bacterium]